MVRNLLLVLLLGLAVSACSKEDVDKVKDTGKASMEKAGEMADDMMNGAKEMGEAAMDKGAEMVENGKEMASDAMDATMEKGAEMMDDGKEMTGDALMKKDTEMAEEAADH